MAIVNYLKDTRIELRSVKWPSRRTTLVFTAIVIALALGAALLLGFFDVIFNFVLKTFII